LNILNDGIQFHFISIILLMDDKDKYIEKAKKVEKRINNYSKEAERLVNHLSDLTIEFISELSSLKKHDKKKEG
jgi:hypothetical protein